METANRPQQTWRFLWLFTVAFILTVLIVTSGSHVAVSYAQETGNQETVTESTTEEAFQTQAASSYTVMPNGSTRVEHRFTITNLKPTTYLKQYLIKLQFPSVSEITATTQGHDLKPYVVKDGPVTIITLNFEEDVVGEGKTRTFTIAYSSNDLSVGSGNVLELRIPALAGTQASQHLVHINVPIRYGEPVRSNPKFDKLTVLPEAIQLQYNSFPAGGISALFGSEQTYALTTQYRLQNPSSSLGYTQIALPPDTSYQRMQYRQLDPRPESMKIDEDGNWIATYLLTANSETTVTVETQVTVTLEPDPLVPVIQPKPDHVSEKPYWPANGSAVKSFAQPAQLRAIYDNVIKTLAYDTKRVQQGDIVNRIGAEGALKTPSAAVCQEYADLLIAGWRSAGIPARRLNGYAYSQNLETRPLSFRGTVLHAWVDYFDQASGRWRMVDPTWEDTTGGVDYFSEFDLNHIVLSINGISSSDPAPAGSYLDQPEEALLDVKVSVASPSARPNFTVSVEPTKLFGMKVPGSYEATITNETGRAWYDTQVRLTAPNALSVTPEEYTSTFLPFERKHFPVSLTTALKAGWQTTPLSLTLLAAGESEPVVINHENLTAAPALIRTILSVNPTTPLGVIAILSFLTAGSLLVFGRRRKTPLRRQSQKPQKAPQQLPSAKTTLGANSPDGPNGSDGPVA